MSHSNQSSVQIQAAYRAGAASARAGRMLSAMPAYEDKSLAAAWRDGWTDTAISVGMVGTDWRPAPRSSAA